MATKNPRISVMLSPQSNDILTRLSIVTKQSKSGLIGEFLEESCMPMFERMAFVLEAAANATDDAKIALVQGMLQAEKNLHSLVGLTSDLFDQAAFPVTSPPEAPPGPPYVTRGSGTPNVSSRTSKSPVKVPSAVVSPKNRLVKPSKRLATASKQKTGG